MLDIKTILENKEKVKEALSHRNGDFPVDLAVELEEKRRAILKEAEALKARRNADSEKIAQRKRQNENADDLIAEMKKLGETVKALDAELSETETKLRETLLAIPNLPHESLPIGKSDADNVAVRYYGTPTEFSFEPKAHWDLGAERKLFDMPRAAKISGSRFAVYRGLGAKLERALITFMLDTHTQNGYTEILPPYLVNRASMTGTGQLPKFEEDAFSVKNNDMFLIPTAEVPVTNLHRDEMLHAEDLPIRYCAYSACFRSEAGSAGRDTRGLIRLHQFNKVELVKFVRPESSYEELEKLTNDAERILQLLDLPYRVSLLCTGDVGFSSAKTYDLEVWLPSYGRYVEISSCSNFEDYQARRANIRFKTDASSKPQFVHTLNGSGLAVGRTFAAILENYQNEDGSISVPDVLKKYVGCDVIR